MGDKTKIHWTEATWNPVTGCTPVSAGCKNCYAEKMAKRLRGMGQDGYKNGFVVTCHEKRLDQPIRWRRPRKVFVCSMGDLFHDDVPDEFIRDVYQAMILADHHVYQVLTKRPFRMKAFLDGADDLGWFDITKHPHIWHGTSVESMKEIGRVRYLLECNSVNIFLSMEPLLGPIDWPLSEVDWIIVGGESGPGAREMKVEWVESVFGSAYKGWNQMHPPPKIFVKQMGGHWAKGNSKNRKGDDPSEWPEWARVRETPWDT